MPIYDNPELTPKEHLIMEHEAEQARLIREYSLALKERELEITREKNKAAIELKKLEAQWATWLRIPIIILKLPIALILGFGYIVSVICKWEPPKEFWNYLR